MKARRSHNAALLLMSLLFGSARAAPDPIIVGPELVLPGVATAVASDGTNFLAVWPCGSAICGARVTASGGAVEAQTLVTTVAPPSSVNLAFDGAQFLVVWRETRDRTDIYAARITLGGTNLDPGGFVVSRDLVPPLGQPGRYSRFAPDVGFDGTYFNVYWIEDVVGDQTLFAFKARVSTSGELLDPAGNWFPIGTGVWVELAVDGPTAVITSNHRSGGRLRILAPDGGGTPEVPSGGSGFRVFFSPDVSAGGLPNLIVFHLQSQHTSPLFNGVFGYAAGALLQFSLTDATATDTRPLATYDGMNHLVVWNESGGAVGVRLSPSAQFLETREACVEYWDSSVCTRISVPQFIAPGAATRLASNRRGVSLITFADSARLLVTNFDLGVLDALGTATSIVNALPADTVKNIHQRDALENKLRSIGNLIGSAAYSDALVELANIVGKTNGCALGSAPENDDWITTCEAQLNLYTTLNWALDIVQQRLAVTP
jgi:hypothetical protein